MKESTLKAGTKLNMRYRLIRSIGQGGFGITYIAEDEVMKQYVVVKEYFPILLVERGEMGELVLPESEKDRRRYQEGMDRFLKEAKILAALFEVPGIVKVLGYFQENVTAYIVMEHIRGESLRSYLERMESELSFEKTCEMLKPVMIALEKVHQKGLLHRDINPDNLMVEEDGKVKILDFGSAREYFLEQDREKTMTILVKNGYAPPEQYEGKGGQGPWTDIYALCATMYEMMTGCIPPNSRERELEDELYAPSTYDVKITPEQEESFLKKGMALEKKDRYHTIQEMMEDFFPEEREKKEKRNSRKKAVIAIGVMAALVLLIVGYVLIQTKPQQETHYAGSYARDSKEYKEFMEYVAEHAVSSEKSVGLDGFDTICYVLDEETVKKIDTPSNVNTFRTKADELLESLEQKGYVLESTEKKSSFEVEEGGYGSVKTSFLLKDKYITPDGVQITIMYEYFTKEIAFIWLSNQDGTGADYSSIAFDIVAVLAPDLAEDITPDQIQKGKKEFEERDEKDNQYVRGFETREIFARFRWNDSCPEAIFFFTPYGISYEEPEYRW